MIEETLSIGWSQDQHNFHRRLQVNRVCGALRDLFPDNAYTAELNTMFYGGDFFDHLADDPTDDESLDVLAYMGWRLKMAAKNKIKVRVLKGTPSHDRDQNAYWVAINNLLETPADLIYVDKLWIESHPEMGDILYIPDCWKPTADEVWEDVCEAMRQKNITKVDWIIMHGAFKHQLPPHLHDKLHSLHDSDRYADITRKYVLVGHVHLKSQYRNIISAGSLDRLAFGEEDPKGALRIDCRPHGDDITFMENDQARTMVTLDVDKMEFEDVVKLIDKTIGENDHTYMSVRLLASKLSDVYINLSVLEKNFFPVEIVFKDNDTKQKANHLVYLDVDKKPITTVDLSDSNIIKLVKEKIGEGWNDDVNDKLNDIFGVKS